MSTTKSHYAVLAIPPDASAEDIAAAYQRQRARYQADHLAARDDEFQRITTARFIELDRAYAVLSDPERRRAYDQGRESAASNRPGVERSVSRRELLMTLGGALVGLLAIIIVWVVAGERAQPALPAVSEINRPAPEFALPGLDGETVRLSEYRGKVVLVNFWGTWCEPCKEETPALQAAYAKHRDDGLIIIGVDLRKQERAGADGDADIRAFVEQYGVTYPIALDMEGATARDFAVLPLPTSYFIDQSGVIRYVRVGQLHEAEITLLFEQLVEQARAQQ